MKNSIKGIEDIYTIKDYYEFDNKITARNLNNDKITYLNEEMLKKEMIRQAEIYVKDIKKIKYKSIYNILWIIGMLTITITSFFYFPMLAITLPAVLSLQPAIIKKIIEINLENELLTDKNKYREFLKNKELIDEYNLYSNNNSPVSINELDEVEIDYLKSQLKFMSNHLKFLKHSSETKISVLTKKI